MYIRDQNAKNQSARLRPPDNYSGTVFRSGEAPNPPVDIPLPPGLLNDENRLDITNDPIPGHTLRPNFIRKPSPINDEVTPPPLSNNQFDFIPDNKNNTINNIPNQDSSTTENTNVDKEDGTPIETYRREPLKNPLKNLFSSIIPKGLTKSKDSNEFGFEEILIIGLILLLSQNDDDSNNDILLILALLLFLQ